MPSAKEYEMLFKLNAQQNSGFKTAFSQAQAEFAKLGNEIQSLNRLQGDIASYQKQQAAIENTRAKIGNLTRQHDALQEELAASARQEELFQRQIEESTGDTSELEQELAKAAQNTARLQGENVKLEERLRSTNVNLENQQGRLGATEERLKKAGVSTSDLAGKNQELSARIQDLHKRQEEAARSAEEYGSSAAAAFSVAGEALAAAGLVKGVQELAGAYLETVKAAGGLQSTMSNVEALSEATAQEMAQLRAQAKELGADTKFTATENGDAMGYMGMAGWNAQQMLAGMPGVIDLAAASGEDLAEVSDIVTDSLTGFKRTAADTSRFVDVLAVTSTKSNTNVSMLGETFKYVAPLCGTLGYEVEDTAVLVGLMANSGIKASQAGTTLRTSISNLLSPTKEQAAEMKRLGISVTGTNGEMLPLLDLTGRLRERFSGMSEAEQSVAASTLFGKEAMSGMLAVINASEEDFNSLTESIYNSAGAAKRMADIKMDNLNGQLTLMQSAADGLTVTIGELFLPQMQDLAGMGTDVLTWVNDFVEDHPALVKAVLATTGVVGGLTAGIVAFNAAKKAAQAIDLAAMFAGPVGPVLAVAGAVTAVGVGIAGLVEAANEGVPKVDELTQAAQEVAATMEQVAGDFDASRVNIAASAEVAGMYITRLDELDTKTRLTAEETEEYHNILQLLSETVPNLAGSIDLTTDSIDGGTEALRRQTEAWRKNAQAQAYQEAYQRLLGEYNDVRVEQAENSLRLTEAEAKLNRNMEERARLMAEIAEIEADGTWRENADKTEYYYDLGKQVNDLDAEIRKDKKTVDAYREAVDRCSDAAADAEEAAKGYAEAMDALTGESKGAAHALDDVQSSLTAMTDAFSLEKASDMFIIGALTGIGQMGDAYQELYQTAYDEAYDSISGQMGLFESMAGQVDKYAKDSELSLDGMIKSMQSQAAYMDEYSANLQKAHDLHLEDSLLAQLSDGSVESAAYLQQIVDGGEEKIKELNDAFEDVKKGKEEFSKQVAGMKKDFDKDMREMAQNASDTIADMNLYNEAYAAGLSTMQGYLNAINGMSGPVAAAAGNIGWGVVSAMNSALSAVRSVKIPGHAAGTSSAAPGLALVGEQGPELVVFQGGERVINASETRALTQRAALGVASPSARSGGGAAYTITVAPVYNISGGAASSETERVLQRNNHNLRELILDTLREVEIDEARRAFL